MRDRLIELLREAENKVQETLKEKFQLDLSEWIGIYADYLLANGVIVPPCKVGGDIWYIDPENGVSCEKGGIKKIIYSGNGKFEIMGICGGIDEIGSEWCCLSKEQVEQLLKGGVSNAD